MLEAGPGQGLGGPLLRLALEGDRVRRASRVIERESLHLASALRRAVPFISRRGIPVTLTYARAIPLADILSEIARPIHAVPLAIERAGEAGGSRGALILDCGAIQMILDGVLGGNGQVLPDLPPEGRTAPPTALVARVAEGVVRALSEVLSRRVGIRLTPGPIEAEEGAQEAPVACSLEFGEGMTPGRVLVLLPKEALLAPSDEAPPAASPRPDARVAAVLDEVELELVAELARVRLTVGRISSLRVGETLRLEVAVGDPVAVRVDDTVVLHGLPTTNAGALAIRVESGHER